MQQSFDEREITISPELLHIKILLLTCDKPSFRIDELLLQ